MTEPERERSQARDALIRTLRTVAAEAQAGMARSAAAGVPTSAWWQERARLLQVALAAVLAEVEAAEAEVEAPQSPGRGAGA